MHRTHRQIPEAIGLALASLLFGVVMPADAVAQVRAAYVKDVDNPARQAVTLKKYSSSANVFELLYTVPADKVFVMEHMNCSALADNFYGAIFDGGLSHGNIRYSVPGTSASVLIADGATRTYFAPGAQLNIRMFTTDPGQMVCTVSGYTVDAA